MFFKLTVLSPVHVGCGVSLSKNIDFFTDRDTTFVLDIDSAMHAFPDLWLSQANLDIGRLKDALSKRGGEKFVRKVTPPIKADEILLQMRDGRGAMLIPGSTIKGALRTAMIGFLGFQDIQAKKGLVQDIVQSSNLKSRDPGRRLEDHYLRRTPSQGERPGPHEDIFRAVVVGDCAVTVNAEPKIFEVHVKSPVKDDMTREKDFVIACEGVPGGATGFLRMGVDEFLLSKKWRGNAGLPTTNVGFGTLAQATKVHILRSIQDERAYFERVGLPQAVEFIDALKKEVELAGNSAMFLRLGWGIGWCGTTGAILNPDERLALLHGFEKVGRHLSKNDAKSYDNLTIIFPKTRRYVVGSAEPQLFGFVRLEEVEEDKMQLPEFKPCTFPAPQVLAKEETPEPVTEPPPAIAEKKKVSYVELMISSVKPREVKPRFEAVFREIQSLKDPEEKIRGLRALKELVLKHIPKTDEAFYSKPDVVRLFEECKDEEPKA
jgi:CRISPR type III-A-associated RAMP protein Csm5